MVDFGVFIVFGFERFFVIVLYNVILLSIGVLIIVNRFIFMVFCGFIFLLVLVFVIMLEFF